MEWYKWYPAIYEADTEHLTAEQDGIYRRLIDRYMRTRQPLPDNDNALARIAGVTVDSWCHASAIVKPFFKAENGKLFHKFCDKQLAEQDATTRAKSVIGKIGAEKRWNKTQQNQQPDGDSHASAIATPMQEEKRRDRDKIIRASRLPADWVLPDEWRLYAASRGLSNAAYTLEADKFRDYWIAQPGQKGVKADWFATWRNWIRNVRPAFEADKKQPPRKAFTGQPWKTGETA